MAGLPPVVMPSTKQATLIVVRGCHVILTLRASSGNRASEDLTLQVANAMASPAALRFPGSVRDSRSA